MRIMLVVTDLGRTGTPAYVETLALGLLGRGHEVTVVAESPPLDRAAVLRDAGSVVVSLSETGVGRLGAYRLLGSQIDQHRPELVHVNVWRRHSEFLSAAGRRGIPQMVTVNTIPLRDEWWERPSLVTRLKIWGAARRDRWTDVRRGTHFIAVCEATRKGVLALYGEGIRSRVHTVLYGVNVFDRVAARAPGPLRIVWMGSLITRKDPMQAADIVERLVQRKGPGAATLTMLGDGPLRGALEARKLPWLDLKGNIRDASARAAEYDVYLQTSAGEALSIALLEALAAGLPAVASDVSGTSEVVRNGATGCLFRYGDIATAAEALGDLSDSTDTWARLSAGARAEIVARCTIDRMIDGTVASYRKALGAHPGVETGAYA